MVSFDRGGPATIAIGTGKKIEPDPTIEGGGDTRYAGLLPHLLNFSALPSRLAKRSYIRVGSRCTSGSGCHRRMPCRV
jgi:hypothetical protein